MKKSVTGAGTKVSLEVPVLAVEDKPAAAAATAATSPGSPSAVAVLPNETEPARTQRTIAWIAGGLGVVGMGIGSYFGLRAMSKKNDYGKHVGADGACLDRECETLSREAHSAGNASTIGFVAGGALVATGVVLWLTAPSGKGKEARPGVLPVAGPRSAGLQFQGSW
jgi:hypothetical protein